MIQIQPQLSKHLMPVTERPAKVFVRGEGAWLWDAAGTRYLDWLQGWAVNALGHQTVYSYAGVNETAAQRTEAETASIDACSNGAPIPTSTVRMPCFSSSTSAT